MVFEERHRPLIPLRAFVLRQLAWAVVSMVLVLASLTIGSLGYRATENMPWLDATHHAAMILTGMGPVTQMHTDAGKRFEIVFALFSGVIFLTSAALVIAPLAHRILHRFHIDSEDSSASD